MQSRKQRKNDALDKRKHCFKQNKRVLFLNVNIYLSTLNTYIGVLNINLRDATTLIDAISLQDRGNKFKRFGYMNIDRFHRDTQYIGNLFIWKLFDFGQHKDLPATGRKLIYDLVDTGYFLPTNDPWIRSLQINKRTIVAYFIPWHKHLTISIFPQPGHYLVMSYLQQPCLLVFHLREPVTMLPYFKENIAYNLFRFFSRANKILSIVNKSLEYASKRRLSKRSSIWLLWLCINKASFFFNDPITFDKDTKKQTSSFKTRYISLSLLSIIYLKK